MTTVEQIIDAALDSRLGVLVETNDVDAFLRRFYTAKRARADSGDTSVSCLSAMRSRTHADQVLILKNR